MTIRHRAAALAAAAFLALAGCVGEPTWAPEEEVMRALHYVEGPSKITLFTVRSTRDGSGGHSGLMVSDTHRALFDPAGTFYHPRAPERNDVHYGITDRVLAVYIDYHARETYDVIVQEVEVPAEVARLAMREIQAYGAVPKAHCTRAVSIVLSRLPGFEGIGATWFPNALSDAFARLPGATYRVISDDDADKNHGVLLQAAAPYIPETLNRE
jgi:hypothetical protein